MQIVQNVAGMGVVNIVSAVNKLQIPGTIQMQRVQYVGALLINNQNQSTMTAKTITTEDRARIFGMYLGAECQRFYRRTGVIAEESILMDCSNIHAIVNGTGTYTYKLLLTPVSKITDADAIEVAKVVFPNAKNQEIIIKFVKGLASEGKIGYNMADELRRLGYALPYRGLDLFKLGIAIEKK